jgi:hypothetical protein
VFKSFGKQEPKPATLMDSFIKAIYGDNPPPKRADVSEAALLAGDQLLGGAFDSQAVVGIATQLSDGPIPYSTHDLAVSIALRVFKDIAPEKRQHLFAIQLMARLTVCSWLKEGKVVGPLAAAFEDSLYKDYKS